MSLNKYRVRCTTDNKYEYVWAETTPTTCPINTHHSIDSTLTSIVDTKEDNEVVIREEGIKTGGHYQAQSFDVICDATTGWKEKTVSFPFPIGLLSAEWRNKTENDGDEIEVCVGVDTIIGTLTSDVSEGDEINVTQSVIDNIAIGFKCSITDGTNTDDLGRILSVSPSGLTLTVETDVVTAFIASTPTYVRQTIVMIPRLVLADSGTFELGGSKIGASYIPANIPIRIRYNNISATAKTFSIVMEYLY